MTTWEVDIFEQDNTHVRPLVNANIEKIVKQVRHPGEIILNYPKTDPPHALGQDADVQMLREIRVLRDGEVYKWGVITRRKSASGQSSRQVTAPGLGWWLNKRRIGKTRTNLLTNGSFNTNTTGWTASGVTATQVGTPARRGSGAVELVQGTTWADNHLHQTVADVAGGGIGNVVVLAGWFRIPDWTGPAFENRGLFIEGRDSTTNDLRAYSFFEIDDTYGDSLDTWHYAETELWVPPADTWDLDVRLYGPDGEIIWDEIALVKMESLAVSPAGEDIAAIAERIIEHIQDPANDKTDLHWGTNCPDAGVTLYHPKAWQHVDRTPAHRAIDAELAPLGFDWDFDHPTTTSKRFCTYAPRKSNDLTATVTLLYRQGDRASNIADHTFDENVDYVVTDWTIQGEGVGPAREEGRAVDTSDLDGHVLEDVYSAPPGVTSDMLDPLAASRLARTKTIQALPTITTHQGMGDLVGLLDSGDLVHVTIDDGGVQIDEDLRILRLEVTPRNNTLVLTLGPPDAELPPSEEQLIERLLWRIEDKERSGRVLERPSTMEEAVFSQDGPVTAATSNVWPVTTGGQITLAIAELKDGEVAGANIDCEVYSAALGLLGTITIPAGDGAQKAYLGNWRIPPSDSLWAVLLDTDTAEGFTLKLRMKG